MDTDATPATYPVVVTSNLSQPAAASMSTEKTTEYLVRFPPFPTSPDGANLVLFKEFKEKGIRVQPGGDDNETEVDAWGVPTIALPSSHTTDWCKTETKRAKFNNNAGPGRKKRKRRAGAGGANAGPTSADWEEYWEEREASYRIRQSYDPHASAYERLCQGAWDFKNSRPWPLAQKQSGPVFVWGEFLRFAGIPLIDAMNSTAKVDELTPKPKTGDDADSDLESEEDEDGPMSGILNPQNLASMEATMKAQARGEGFLADPAGMLKVFFSSYARDRGIIWTDLNLTGAPILMRFFINFLIDNKVLPNHEENAIKHESTRRIIEDALKELPLTSKLSKVWPDEFHKACRECWGSKAEVFVFADIPPMEDVPGNGNEDATINETDGKQEATATEGAWGNITDAPNSATDNGWGGDWGSGGWNNASGDDEDAWDSRVVTVDVDDDGNLTTKTPDFNINDNPEEDDRSWNVFKVPSLLPLLGPTALPLTHTTGIVESSLRRIKTVLQPSADVSKFAVAKDLSPEAVEGVLRRTFGVIVFEPWVNWNNGEEPHLSMPKILESSRGVVKAEVVAEDGDPKTDASTPATATGVLPPFDPLKDDISALVDSAYLNLFSVGMGCLCTWVQLARVEDFEPQDPKKKKKKNAKFERLWYVEEALRVVPSYYTYPG